MACGCPTPTFKRALDIGQSVTESGEYKIADDELKELEAVLCLSFEITNFPDYLGRRFDYSGKEINQRVFSMGWAAWGYSLDSGGKAFYFAEMPIQFDYTALIQPPNANRVRWWLAPGVEAKVNILIGECPEEEEDVPV